MVRLPLGIICATLVMVCSAQEPTNRKSFDRFGIDEMLGFETQHVSDFPACWGGGAPGTVFVDDKIVHSGRWSARIERVGNSTGGFSHIGKAINVSFTGSKVELRGFLRTEDVSGFAGLWLHEDGAGTTPLGENMQRRQLKGTSPWAEYSIALPLRPGTKQLVFGFLVLGTGKAWADDLKLLVDGKPIGEAPLAEPGKEIIDLDHTFDYGSRIIPKQLSDVQVENLAILGKVWGFLKYHHPRIISGLHHWDYELLRVLPKILAARNRAEANTALLGWITCLGAIGQCDSCVTLKDGNFHLRPGLDWIADETLLGADLSRYLQSAYRNRQASGGQFYVSLTPGIGNPVFEHEPTYEANQFPDMGFQLLALYRFWNVIEYWFPYRDLLKDNWDKVLVQFIPGIALAKDADTYQRQMMTLIAMTNDANSGLSGSIRMPSAGDCKLPVQIRFVENRAAVTGFIDKEAGPASGLRLGDIITKFDGVPISKLIETWTPHFAASNESTRLHHIAAAITQGSCSSSTVHVNRDSEADQPLTTKRVQTGTRKSASADGLQRDALVLLLDSIPYLRVSAMKAPEIGHYIESAVGTKGLIIDLRGQASEFDVSSLGSILIEKRTEIVRYTQGDLSNPGVFFWAESMSLIPQKPHYSGTVVILIDESTQGWAEHAGIVLRTVPHAIIVGSPSAGALGQVSSIPLPWGLHAKISGVGVFYPDKRPIQHRGIVPHIEVRPTIAGIRAGRDEVLERALLQIVR